MTITEDMAAGETYRVLGVFRFPGIPKMENRA